MALFGFNIEAIEVFENLAIQECNGYEKLKLGKCTFFKCAFKKAFYLISNSNLDRNEFIPVIILLTDGLEHGKDETITFVEKISYFIII